MKSPKTIKGFGLIEILVAIFIVAFGVLAVGKLQTTLISSSSDNKARMEALAIAQGTLENIKSYFQDQVSGELISADNFITYIQGYSSANPVADVSGTYATYTVNQSFTTSTDSDVAISLVSVSWSNSSGEIQTVSLNSDLTFQDLAVVGAGSIPEDTNYIEAPTGRARLGDGTIDTDIHEVVSSDFDGTGIYYDSNTLGSDSFDLLLAVNEDQIVLTLEDACVITIDPDSLVTTYENYECTDFVRIRGRVYFNESYRIGTGSGVGIEDINPTDFFVLASDAAYCSRYVAPEFEIVDGVETENILSAAITLDVGDHAELRIDDLPFEETTAKSKQYYYDYICYIGGGWYGNIGIVSSNTLIDDAGLQACVGDPSGALDTVEFALRRSYRGMVWKNDATKTAFTPILDANGDNVLYYSWGVADASEIGGNDTYNHDFMIVSDASDCNDVNIYDEVTFNTNVDDFFCLNEITSKASGLLSPDEGDLNSDYTTTVDVSAKTNGTDKYKRSNLDERNLDKNRDGKYENKDEIGYYDY